MAGAGCAHSSSVPIDPSIARYVADATLAHSITSVVGQHVHRGLGDRFELTTSPRLSVSLGASASTTTGLAETGDLDHEFDRDLPAVLQGHVYPGSKIVDGDGNDLAVPQDFFEMRDRAVGGYLEVVAQPLARVALTAGVRADTQSRYGRSVSPRVGLTVQPDDNTHVKLLYGQAFLAPSPNQTFGHHGSFEPVENPAGEVVGLRSIFFRLPNPDLLPERVRMGELIVFRRAGELRVSGNAYLADVRDRFGSGFLDDQTYMGWPVDQVLIPVNLDERVVTYGGNLGLDGRVAAGRFTLQPAIAYSVTAGHRGDDPLPATSRHVVKAALDVDRGPLSLSVRTLMRSAARHPETRDAAGELVSIDGSAIVNLPGVPQDPIRVMVGLDAEL